MHSQAEVGTIPSKAHDEELARKAIEKLDRGDAPTARETEALNRVRRRREEEMRDELLGAIPKGWWVENAGPGRAHQTVDAQAKLYGAPLLGRSINLGEFVAWFHDFLKENAVALAKARRAEDTIDAQLDAARLEQLNERTAALRLQNLLRDGQVVEIADVRVGFDIIGHTLRTATEQLLRRLSPKDGRIAHDILETCWDDCRHAMQEHFTQAYDNDNELPTGPNGKTTRTTGTRKRGANRVRQPGRKSKSEKGS